MDRYQIMSLLSRLEITTADPYLVSILYAKILADIADRLTAEEVSRLLFVGAFIHKNCQAPESVNGAEFDMRTSHHKLAKSLH